METKSNQRTHWQRVKELFTAVLDEPAEGRRAQLARLCQGDQDLQREVERLLLTNDGDPDFMETPGHLSGLV